VNKARLFGLYTARFPFLETQQDKIRPVLVISDAHGEHRVIAVIPVSSTAMQEKPDVKLAQWKIEGLLKPSIARVHKLTTMLQSDLLSELGILEQEDIVALQASLRDYLAL
jgi:mRNA-degrading endonuclease toxin of MazEF toxin-antitoxin module